MKTITRKNFREIRKKKDSGFTFAETLAVLAVTAILSSQIGLGAHRMIEKARVAAAKTEIEQLKLSLQSYYADCGSFPTEEQGLMALWEEPLLYPLPENWSGPYTDKKIVSDPWGSQFLYLIRGSASSSNLPEGLPFGIVCLGADRTEGGEGCDKDIFSWE